MPFKDDKVDFVYWSFKRKDSGSALCKTQKDTQSTTTAANAASLAKPAMRVSSRSAATTSTSWIKSPPSVCRRFDSMDAELWYNNLPCAPLGIPTDLQYQDVLLGWKFLINTTHAGTALCNEMIQARLPFYIAYPDRAEAIVAGVLSHVHGTVYVWWQQTKKTRSDRSSIAAMEESWVQVDGREQLKERLKTILDNLASCYKRHASKQKKQYKDSIAVVDKSIELIPRPSQWIKYASFAATRRSKKSESVKAKKKLSDIKKQSPPPKSNMVGGSSPKNHNNGVRAVTTVNSTGRDSTSYLDSWYKRHVKRTSSTTDFIRRPDGVVSPWTERPFPLAVLPFEQQQPHTQGGLQSPWARVAGAAANPMTSVDNKKDKDPTTDPIVISTPESTARSAPSTAGTLPPAQRAPVVSPLSVTAAREHENLPESNDPSNQESQPRANHVSHTSVGHEHQGFAAGAVETMLPHGASATDVLLVYQRDFGRNHSGTHKFQEKMFNFLPRFIKGEEAHPFAKKIVLSVKQRGGWFYECTTPIVGAQWNLMENSDVVPWRIIKLLEALEIRECRAQQATAPTSAAEFDVFLNDGYDVEWCAGNVRFMRMVKDRAPIFEEYGDAVLHSLAMEVMRHIAQIGGRFFCQQNSTWIIQSDHRLLLDEVMRVTRLILVPPTVEETIEEGEVGSESSDRQKPKHIPGQSKSKPKRAKTENPYLMELPKYVTITENDVLCHRGAFANAHPGNIKYREVKVSLQPQYEGVRNDQKMEITKRLVAAVHEWGGRFLERDPATGKWFETEYKRAYQKASQALRENLTKEDRAAKRAKYYNPRKAFPEKAVI